VSFDEAQHPRAADGKFGEGAGGEGGGKKKYALTGATNDLDHALARAKYHAENAKKHAEKAASATKVVDKKKFALAAAVSAKKAGEHAKAAEKAQKKDGGDQAKVAQAKIHAEAAKSHAATAADQADGGTNHASNAVTPGLGHVAPASNPAVSAPVTHASAPPAYGPGPHPAQIAAKAASDKANSTHNPDDHNDAAESHKDAAASAKAAGLGPQQAMHEKAANFHELASAAEDKSIMASTPSEMKDAAKAHLAAAQAAKPGSVEKEYHSDKVAELRGGATVNVQASPSGHVSASAVHVGAAQELSHSQFAEYKKSYNEKLTSAQKSSVKAYTGNSYVGINGPPKGLRYPPPESAYAKHIKNIDEAMKKTPLAQDTLVHRGVNGLATLNAHGVGDTFGDNGYSSTSIRADTAFDHKDVMMHISVPKGYPALVIGNSAVPHENEILLARGAQFKITKKEMIGSKLHITCEVVHHAA
jgi:ADP-ribosyltransferase exoenzyme